MSVDVTRKSSPPTAIVVTDSGDDTLTFEPVASGRFLRAIPKIKPSDHYVEFSRNDARALGEALIEWADAVEVQA